MEKIALTIDLEFLEENHYLPKSDVKTVEEEKKAVRQLLDLLDEYDQKITFFAVANLCDNHLELLEEIRDRGHEIASHSYTHPNLTEISPEQLEREVKDSKERLEKELDIEVKGFRAPELRINQKVYEEIESTGYEYDSSKISSFKIPGWYGGYGKQRPHTKGEITEMPVSANPITKTPISGFFFRTLGEKHLNWSVMELHKRDIVPVIYLHPYELASFDGKKNWRQRFRTGEFVNNMIRDVLYENDLTRMENLI
jgi:peptidoglycan/xylan/chitin deacetylase (PgdA/CDA1 family)